MSYAENTRVPISQTKQDIERVLSRYGAGQFMYGWDQNRIVLGFQMHNRMIRFVIDAPTREEFKYKTERGYKSARTDIQIDAMIEQSQKQKWRALLLVIKAKLEAVESKISGFEEEFLAHIVLPNNQTVGAWIKPQIAEVYASKKMPLFISDGDK